MLGLVVGVGAGVVDDATVACLLSGAEGRGQWSDSILVSVAPGAAHHTIAVSLVTTSLAPSVETLRQLIQSDSAEPGTVVSTSVVPCVRWTQ